MIPDRTAPGSGLTGNAGSRPGDHAANRETAANSGQRGVVPWRALEQLDGLVGSALVDPQFDPQGRGGRVRLREWLISFRPGSACQAYSGTRRPATAGYIDRPDRPG